MGYVMKRDPVDIQWINGLEWIWIGLFSMDIHPLPALHTKYSSSTVITRINQGHQGSYVFGYKLTRRAVTATRTWKTTSQY
jgi:hypothetical protein